MHGRQTDWDTWGSGHANSREEEATSLQELLPTGRALSADHLDIIKGKLPVRLEKVLWRGEASGADDHTGVSPCMVYHHPPVVTPS